MDDARNLQYGIGFDTADAETSVDNLGEKVETLEENIGAVEVGAQQMGASAVSACQMGQGAAERFTGAVGDASGGLDDMASSASEAGNAAQKAAGHWNMTAEGLEWVEEAAQAAEAAAESFREEMDDSGGAAGRFRAQIKKTAESAQDMGTAFNGAMADGLDAGQSIAKSFRTGVTGAMDFTKKRAEIFANNMVRNAKNISKAFQHPIKIIRSGLVSALRRAKKSEDETADGADDAGDHLAEMGAAGEDAGNQIKEAISGAVKAFVGFEAIKRGIELLKQFGAAAVSAFSDAESTSKKFGRSFSEEAAAWADNYADAVHRSTAEVQSFMVSNKAILDVITHITELNYCYSGGCFIAGAPFWEKLSDEDKAAFKEAAQEASDEFTEFFREKTEKVTNDGVASGQWTVDQPSDDMKAKLQEIYQQIWEESRGSYSDEIMDAITSGDYKNK